MTDCEEWNRMNNYNFLFSIENIVFRLIMVQFPYKTKFFSNMRWEIKAFSFLQKQLYAKFHFLA